MQIEPYVDGVAWSIYLIPNEEVLKLLEEFTTWDYDDFWDGNPKGINKMIIDFSQFPNALDEF